MFTRHILSIFNYCMADLRWAQYVAALLPTITTVRKPWGSCQIQSVALGFFASFRHRWYFCVRSS